MEFRVPFYPNTPDDTHCFQAALRMVLAYFLPQQEYSWEELDQMTAKREGLWTWPMAGLLELQRKGFEIVNLEMFDYKQFAQKGDEYLYEFLGKEVAQAQIEHSDIHQERRFAKEYVKKIHVERRTPSISDIVNLLDSGFLVICNVNSRRLNRTQGYAGHFVVITGHSDNELALHDPGLPPLKDRAVSIEEFEQAWDYPDASARNVTGLRYSL